MATKERVGVRGSERLFPEFSKLKRDALFFDRIMVPELEYTCDQIRRYATKERREIGRQLGEIEWLIEQGIICDTGIDINEVDLATQLSGTTVLKDYRRYEQNMTGILKHFLQLAQKGKKVVLASPETQLAFDEINTRVSAALLNLDMHYDAVPFLPTNLTTVTPNPASKTQVMEIVLKAVPIPDDSVPWEQVLDFRGDKEVKEKLVRLRGWVSEIAQGNLSQRQTEDKVETLLNEYRHYMHVQRMKVSTGALKTIVVATAEFLEDLAKAKWGKIARGLFAIRSRQIDFLEAELKAPGRELAYIDAVTQRFPQRPHVSPA